MNYEYGNEEFSRITRNIPTYKQNMTDTKRIRHGLIKKEKLICLAPVVFMGMLRAVKHHFLGLWTLACLGWVIVMTHYLCISLSCPVSCFFSMFLLSISLYFIIICFYSLWTVCIIATNYQVLSRSKIK